MVIHYYLNNRILVLAVSAPVVLVDEILKVFSRIRNVKLLAERKKIDWYSKKIKYIKYQD